MHTVYLGLGTNMGQRERLMAEAICKINELIGRIVRQSALLETEPWGFSSPNRFLNAVVCVETRHDPYTLLRLTQLIERQLGRTSKSSAGHYHDRPMDIDILLYDRLRINDAPRLVVPHPLMWQREFVTKPLREIMTDEAWHEVAP